MTISDADLNQLADDLTALARAAERTIETLERMDGEGRPGAAKRAVAADYARGRMEALDYAAQQIHELLAPF